MIARVSGKLANESGGGGQLNDEELMCIWFFHRIDLGFQTDYNAWQIPRRCKQGGVCACFSLIFAQHGCDEREIWIAMRDGKLGFQAVFDHGATFS